MIALLDLNIKKIRHKIVSIVWNLNENFPMPISLPDNIVELKNEEFFSVVQQQCGKIMAEILRYLEINSADYLLNFNVETLFAFFHQDSPDLTIMKSKVEIMLNNGSFVVKKGLLLQADTLIQALHLHQHQNSSSTSKDITISSARLNEHPILRQVIDFFEHSSSQFNSSTSVFTCKSIETIISNYFRAKSRCSYSDSIREFASCIYIFGGRGVYEFIRINLPDFLPSLTVLHREIHSTAGRIVEGEFRYDSMTDYLTSQGRNFIFAAEDCTAVVPRIVFDTKTNTFVGFTLCLENWFDTSTKSHRLNLQMVQPINLNNIPGPPFILSSYGTDNYFKTDDILMKWINMINRCNEKKVKLVGFSTDCDPRYLRSMRLFSGFFADMPNQQIHMRHDAFHVDIPKVVFNSLNHSSFSYCFLYLS